MQKLENHQLKKWILSTAELGFGLWPTKNCFFEPMNIWDLHRFRSTNSLDLTNNDNNLGLTNWSFAFNETAQKS